MKNIIIFAFVFLFGAASFSQKSTPLTPEERKKLVDALEDVKKALPSEEELNRKQKSLVNLQESLGSLQIQSFKMMGFGAFAKNYCGDKTWLKDYNSLIAQEDEKSRAPLRDAFLSGWEEAKQLSKKEPPPCKNK